MVPSGIAPGYPTEVARHQGDLDLGKRRLLYHKNLPDANFGANSQQFLMLAVRRAFFNDLRALTRYLHFASWQGLLTFMYQRLDLAPEPD